MSVYLCVQLILNDLYLLREINVNITYRYSLLCIIKHKYGYNKPIFIKMFFDTSNKVFYFPCLDI